MAFNNACFHSFLNSRGKTSDEERCREATVRWSRPRLHAKSGQGPGRLNPASPALLRVFRGDRKSQHLRQMTSCGTGMPWDCADYGNSLNKHGPINHSHTLSNPAHSSAAHLLFCRGGCVFVHSRTCALMCFYTEVHACICISTCNVCSVYL